MLDTLASLGEFLGGVAVIAGVVFAVIQMRQFQHARQREISLELLRSFQTPEFVRGLVTIYNLPDGLDKRAIEEHAGDELPYVYAVMTTWESLGILVFRGEVDLDLVDDFFSGPITISWRKMKPYVMGERSALDRATIEEWFEWLNDRLVERESTEPPLPAHIAHRGWEPRSRNR